MISKKEVEHIAKLSRLGLNKKEIDKFQKELSKILDYINKLKEIDVSGVEPTSHSITPANITREDKMKLQKADIERDLIEAAPKKEKRYVKVKSIL